MSMVLFSDVVILGLMVIMVIMIQKMSDLFTTIIVMGIFSLLCACLFLNMHAVDVAFTEASVGAGIATLLFLATLLKIGNCDEPPVFHWMPFILVILTGVLLFIGIQDIVPFGDAAGAVHTHLSPRYIEQSPDEIGVPNMVTSVLASYRGFDTFGEVTVIFTAGISVLILLGSRKQED